MSDPLNLNLKVGAEIKGNTIGNIKSVSDGFKTLTKALQDAATEALKLQKTQLSEALGHTALVIQNTFTEMNNLSKSTKTTTKEMESLVKVNEHFATKSKTVQSAWKLFSAEIDKGNMTLKDAVNATNRYQIGLSNLERDLKLVAASSRKYTKDETEQKKIIESAQKAIKALNDESKITVLRELELSGALKVTSAGFKLQNNEAYKLLITNDSLAKKVKLLHGELTVYQKAARDAADKSKYYNDALKDLQKASKGNQDRFISLVEVLKKTEKGILDLTLRSKELTVEEKKSVNSIDRFKVVTAELEGKLKRTGSTFKVLNKDGLKAFNNMSIETASKIGILDKSYQTLNSKLKAYQLASGLSSKVTETLKKNLISSGQSFKDLSEKVAGYIKIANGISKVGDKIKVLKFKYDELLTTENKHKKAANSLINEYKKTGSNLELVTAKLSKWKKELDASNASQNKLKKNIADLKIKYAELLQSMGSYGAKAKNLIANTKLEETAVKKLSASLTALNRSFLDAKKHTKTYNESATMLGKTISDLIRGIKTYARYMAASTILRGFTDQVRDSTIEIIAFDQAIHNLAAITQASETDVLQLSDTLLKVSKDTKFGITEVATAMQRMAQAGFTANEITAGIGNVANLATGSLESLEETVKLVSTSVKVFNLDMSDTGMVADVFANAVTKSRLTVQGLNTTMNYIGPIAAAAGLDIKDASAALELLTNSGMRFSTSATGLRRILNGLLNPSDDFAAAVMNAGYSMDDVNPRISGFAEVVRLLPKIVTNAEDAFKMFGIRGAAAISAFTTQGVSEYKRLRKGLDQVGTAHKMAEEQMKGLDVSITMIGTKFNDLVVILSKQVVPVIKVLLDGVKGLLDVFIAFAETGIGKVTSALGFLAAALGTVSFLTYQFMTMQLVSKVLTWIKVFKTYMYALIITGSATKALEISTYKCYANIATFGGAIKALSSQFKKTALAIFTFATSLSSLPLIAVISSVVLLVSSLLNQRKALKETIKINGEYGETLENIIELMKSYKNAIIQNGIDSEDAKEKNKKMIESLDALKEKYPHLTDKVERFKIYLDNLKGSTLDTTKALKENAEFLTNQQTDAFKKAADASAELYKRNKALESFKHFFISADEGLQGIEKAIKAYDNLKKASSEGNGEAQKALTSILKGAEIIAKETLASIGDVSKLSEKEIAELAFASEGAQGKTSEYVGAIVAAMKTQAAAAKQSVIETKRLGVQAASISGIAKNVGSYLTKMWNTYDNESENYIGNVSQHMEEFRNKEIVNIEKNLKNNENAMQTELQITKQFYDEKYKALDGNLKEQLLLTDVYEQKVAEIERTGTTTKLQLLKAKRDLVVKQLDIELNDISDYHKNTIELFKQKEEKEMGYHKTHLEDKLRELENSGKTEAQIISGTTEAYLTFYKKQVETAEIYSKKTLGVVEQELEERKTILKATTDDEDNLSKDLHQIEKDRLKAVISSLKERKTGYDKYIKDLKSLEQSLTEAIKSEKEKRAGIEKTAEETLRDLRYKTLTDEQIQAEESKRLAKVTSEYKTQLQQGNTGEALKLNEELMDGWKAYANSIDKDAPDYKGKILDVQSELKTLFEDQKSISTDNVSVLEEQLSIVQKTERVAVAQSASIGTKIKTVMEEYAQLTNYSITEIQRLNEEIAKIPNIVLDTKMDDLKNLTEETTDSVKILIGELEKAITKQQTFNYEKSKEGSSDPGYMAGTIIPGYGGGDRHKAKLESGEAVIPKESVKKFGKTEIRKMIKGITPNFNVGKIQPIVQKTKEFFTNTETKNEEQSFPSYGTLNLTVGDKKFPTLVQQDVMGALQKHIRRSSLMGGNA